MILLSRILAITLLQASAFFSPLATRHSPPPEVAPPPREVAADGSKIEPPEPEPEAKTENPVETIARIIANSKDVGEKLAMTDTSNDTRSTQTRILKDIDSLLKNRDNPPPQGGGQSNDNDQNKSDQNKSDQSKSDQGKSGKDQQQKNGNGNSPKSPSGSGGEGKEGGEKKSESGEKEQAGGRKPRNHPGQPGEQQANAKTGEKSGEKGESGKLKEIKAKPKDDKNGSEAGSTAKGKPSNNRPSVPLDDDVAKDVWGHLPDKLRQQVTQYYQEQFMPKYSNLLKQYYSSLATTPKK